MIPNPRQITVMDLEGKASIVQQILCDLGELFHRLASMGLIHPDLFQPTEYVSTVPSKCLEVIRQMIILCLDDELNRSFYDRLCLFDKLTRWPSDVQDILATATADQFPSDDIRLYRKGMDIRHQIGMVGSCYPPDILSLPPKYQARLEGLHGAHWPCNNYVVLCPPEYYTQLVWHETLHLCFRCNNCYDEDTHIRTCDLSTCVMQWKPWNAPARNGKWLCNKQQEHIRQRVMGK